MNKYRGGGIVPPFLTSALDAVVSWKSRPLYPSKELPVAFELKAEWAKDRCGRCRAEKHVQHLPGIEL
jgi:hypothetical protein